MIIKLEEDILEVNTSESFNKFVYLIENHLIIPYVNLEIFVNITSMCAFKQYDKIDFSYLIFKNVSAISWNHTFMNENKTSKIQFAKVYPEEKLTEFILGNNFGDNYGYEFKIECEKQYLSYSELNALTKNGALDFWVPTDTPHFKRNMLEEDVKRFFEMKNIPEEIINFLDPSEIAQVEVLNILEY